MSSETSSKSGKDQIPNTSLFHGRGLLDLVIRDGNYDHNSQSENRKSKSKQVKAWENANGQVAIGVSFASDWLRSWREFSGPITERSKATLPETDQNVNIINRVGENSHPLWLIFSCKKK